MDLFSIEQKLKVQFQDKEWLALAFTHRSYWNENRDTCTAHNERLEFLGDSVLGLLVADYLFQAYPQLDEGALSQIRSQLVDAPACAGYVQQLGIETEMLLGKGEQQNQGKGRESILADLFEAVIGAIYLDQGIEAVRAFLFAHFQMHIDQQVAEPMRNWKAELQDFTQKNHQVTPTYRVLEEMGPSHAKIFKVGVWIHEEKLAEGEGLSKKEAQIQAAKNALTIIEG